MRVASLIAAVLAVGIAGADAVGAVTPVTVRMTDTKTTLSRQTAAAGVVVFAITNAGRKPRSFDMAGHVTPAARRSARWSAGRGR